mgnify:CR=1 FL=1
MNPKQLFPRTVSEELSTLHDTEVPTHLGLIVNQEVGYEPHQGLPIVGLRLCDALQRI